MYKKEDIMKEILFICLGFFICQLLIVLIFKITDEDEYRTIYISTIILLLFINLVVKILTKIKNKHIKRNYIVIRVCNDNATLFYVRIKKRNTTKYYHYGENKYYIEEINSKNECILRLENIQRVHKTNGKCCQEWINKNLVKVDLN